MKTCTQCKQEYPKTYEYFQIRNNRPSGFFSACRKCNNKKRSEWVKDNPEKNREKAKKWARSNKDKVSKMNKRWRNRQSPEKLRQDNKAWRYANLEQARSNGRRNLRKRRARKLQNGFEPYTEQQVLDKYGHNCYLCQQPIDFTVPRTEPKGFHVEHVIAISKGGPDTLENVRPSHAYCNWSKGDKALEDLSKS